MSERDVSAEFSIPLGTLRGMRFRGSGLPFCKVGRRVYYVHEDVVKFIEGCRRRSTSDNGPGKTEI